MVQKFVGTNSDRNKTIHFTGDNIAVINVNSDKCNITAKWYILLPINVCIELKIAQEDYYKGLEFIDSEYVGSDCVALSNNNHLLVYKYFEELDEALEEAKMIKQRYNELDDMMSSIIEI